MPKMPKAGKWKIQMGQGDTIGIIRPLVPFNCIFDTDIGMIELIRNEYRSPDIFNIEYLDSFTSNRDLIGILYHRKCLNPLLLFMNNKEDTETADDLYNQFMDTKYVDILQHSVYTGLYKLVSYFNYSEEIAPILAYANDTEEYILSSNKTLSNFKRVNINDIVNTCTDMNVFYFKSASDSYFTISLPILKSKNIMILDYGFNFDEEGGIVATKETATAELNRCQYSIINAYNRKEIK